VFASRRDFTQPQLFAILALRQFFKTDYRGVVQLLAHLSDLRKALHLKKVPNCSTLCYAEKNAYEGLGIDAQQRELDAIEKQKEEIERWERRLRAEQRAAINGTSVDEELDRGGYSGRYDYQVEEAVTARAKALEADILAESDLGKQVLALRSEKENLLDTVWLATSCSQLTELWTEVNALLEMTPTARVAKALATAPVHPE